MPKRGRPNIGRRLQHAQVQHSRRLRRTEEQHSQENENVRNLCVRERAEESEDHRSRRLHEARLRQRDACQSLTNENRHYHLLVERQRIQQHRMQLRQALMTSFNRLAFAYDPEIDYSSHSKIAIRDMNKVCQFCHALKFKNESPGMCCASGKVVLPELHPPPEPLNSLLIGDTADSKLFLRKIRKFNSCF